MGNQFLNDRFYEEVYNKPPEKKTMEKNNKNDHTWSMYLIQTIGYVKKK